MFIQTEDTPNPNSLKFIPGSLISENPQHFNNIEEARKKSLLAVKLFNINNVKNVFFGKDFITITKVDQQKWESLKPEILMTIMNHLTAHLAIYDQVEEKLLSTDQEGLSDVEKRIIEIIETRVRPSVAMDGGDIVYKGFKDGIVILELRGACGGCPSASITLKSGIESMLQHFIPEVKGVQAMNE